MAEHDRQAPAMERLTDVLPLSEQKSLPALNHFGPDQKGPREVAHAVETFFLA
jgi:hypothetical protein